LFDAFSSREPVSTSFETLQEAKMQGLTLLATFLVMAAMSIAAAVFVGLVVDKLPHIHDMLSLLAFFGTLVVLLPIAWIIAVKLTAPRHPTQA
jgi:uncharacterized membrane protein YqjE